VTSDHRNVSVVTPELGGFRRSLRSSPHGETKFWGFTSHREGGAQRVVCGVYDTVVYRGSGSYSTVVLQLRLHG
jgi:hypothetical protein